MFKFLKLGTKIYHKMSKITQICFFALFFSNINLAHAQTIKGTIQQASLEEVNILIDDILTDIDTILVLDKNKNFKATLSLKDSRSGIIIAEGEEIEFFIEPQDDIFFAFDSKKGAVFSGKNSSNNNFLQSFRRQFDKADIEIGISYRIKRKAPQTTLSKYLDSLQTVQFNYIERKKALYQLSDDFLVYLKTDIIYQLAKYRTEAPDGMFADGRMLVSSAYRAYLEGYLKTNKPQNGESIYVLEYENAKKNLKGKAKFYKMMLVVQQAIDNDTDQNVQNLFYDFRSSNNSYSDLTIFLQRKYKGRESLFTGTDAPNFILSDSLGKKVSLRDFKGKVIYLDFWATNCTPCLKNFQHSNNLREQFKNDDLVFVYISLDENQENAQKMLGKLKVSGGVQLFDTKGFDSDVAMAYNVKSLPNYVVIDRNGKIFNAQNISPWETKILGVLKNALEK